MSTDIDAAQRAATQPPEPVAVHAIARAAVRATIGPACCGAYARLRGSLPVEAVHLHEETKQLFGYVEVESEERWAAIADTDVCQRWWAHMGDVMPSNDDGSPVATELREVFYLE